jgi:hypothetical protein
VAIRRHGRIDTCMQCTEDHEGHAGSAGFLGRRQRRGAPHVGGVRTLLVLEYHIYSVTALINSVFDVKTVPDYCFVVVTGTVALTL